MSYEDTFKERTKDYALRVLLAVQRVPGSLIGDVLVKQIVRSATSVGANYRSACRAKSKPDFIAKLSIALEECDESEYWVELLGAMKILGEKECLELRDEGRQLTAMLTSSIKTARSRS
ncbi:MAG: four helix bundle protein [Bacteroidota bacterium]